METCPKCNSLCVVPIAYGKPSNDLAEAAAMGLVVLGGCLIGYSQANEKCLKCGFTWFQQPVPGVPRKEFQSFISQFHHFLSDIEMRVELSLDALSQQSIEYGRSLGQETATARLRSLMDARGSISASLGEIAHRFSWDSEKLEELLYGPET